MRAGRKFSLCRVVSLMNDARYFFTVLLKTSTCVLHWGWARVVLVCSKLRRLNSSWDNLLTNSFPLSVWICAGMPNLQNHSKQMAFATVSASLFSIAVTRAYLVNASVMQRMYLCCYPAANIGPKRTAWIRRLGWSGIGNGCRSGSLSVDFFIAGIVYRFFMCFRMSE